MRIVFLSVVFILTAGATLAQAWYEPARGTPERGALMDALRPHAERLYGSPVEFMVGDLRVWGNVAFASVGVQRPGGGAIDLYATPGWAEQYFMADADNLSGQALYQRSGATWVVVHHYFGATDVWWADPALCPVWAPVIPEVC